MNTDVRVLANHGQILAQLNTIFELGDARVSFTDFIQGRRVFQPPSQSLFAHAGADGAQELKQTASAKEIQVSSVNVVRVVELLALLTGAGPGVFNPSQALSIEIGGARSSGSGSTGALMGNDQCGEYCHAQQ